MGFYVLIHSHGIVVLTGGSGNGTAADPGSGTPDPGVGMAKNTRTRDPDPEFGMAKNTRIRDPDPGIVMDRPGIREWTREF